MAGDQEKDGRLIVRTYQNRNAPTGEGEIVVDNFGTHWKQVFEHRQVANTGQIFASRHGNKMFPNQ